MCKIFKTRNQGLSNKRTEETLFPRETAAKKKKN